MALIATVNGQPVYSDKQMASIVNTRVTFADGSWCDVATGVVHNNSSGYINIGGGDSGSNAENVTEGPKRVSASALEVRDICANVKIDAYTATMMDKGSGIEYTITGPADLVKAIHANVKGSTLVIEGDGSTSGGGTITINRDGGYVAVGSRPDGNIRTDVVYRPGSKTVVRGSNSVIIGSGSIMSNIFGRGGRTTTIVTNGDSDENTVKITIKVPHGTPVTANHVSGDVVIGDTNGPLTASVQSSNVYAGRVTSAQLSVRGSGGVHVKEVNGVVMAQIQGSGDIKVEHGSMPSLTATVQGSGDIKVGGIATNASLTVQGSGDIRVARVTNTPMKSVMGSGDIRVKHVG